MEPRLSEDHHTFENGPVPSISGTEVPMSPAKCSVSVDTQPSGLAAKGLDFLHARAVI
jgi:hypothetical protein